MKQYLSAAAPPEKIEILKKLAENISLDSDGRLSINWHKPYGFLMSRPEIQEAIRLESVGPLQKKKAPAAQTPKRAKRQRRGGKAALPRPSLHGGAAARGECSRTVISGNAAANQRPIFERNGNLEERVLPVSLCTRGGT